MAELNIISEALDHFAQEPKEDVHAERRDAVLDELESEVIMIMKSDKGPWGKKELAKAINERNPNLEMSYRELMRNLSFLFTMNPNISKIKPWGWEYSGDAETEK